MNISLKMCLEPFVCTTREHRVTENITITSNVEFELIVKVDYLPEH